MSQATTLTIEISPGIRQRLEDLARATSRTESWLVQEALRWFVDRQDRQIEAILRGIADADAGRLVDHDAVAAWLESWGTGDELAPPTCV